MAFGIAVIGLDHWYTGFGVLDTAAQSEKLSLVGGVELRPERLTQAKERFPKYPISGDADALLKNPDVQLVAVCAATDKATPLAIRALKAGKHVVCVKPCARTLKEAEPLFAAAKESDKFFGSFEGMQRLNPRATVLRDVIRSGAIGTPLSFHQVGHGGLPQPWPGETGPSWWTDAQRVPGGAWIDHSIYAVDFARFVLGGEVNFVSGVAEKRVHKSLSVEDYGLSVMLLSAPTGPVTLMFEDTWSSEPGGGVSRYEIIGSKGRVRQDGEAWVVGAGGKETRHAIPSAPFFDFEALTDLLASGKTPPFTREDAHANLAACLNFYQVAHR